MQVNFSNVSFNSNQNLMYKASNSLAFGSVDLKKDTFQKTETKETPDEKYIQEKTRELTAQLVKGGYISPAALDANNVQD